jgi:hypothetical protein
MPNESPVEKLLAPFSAKGPAIKRVHKEGDPEKYFDIMEKEFRPYKRSGARDPNSGAEVVGNEEEFVEVAREARDERLVGLSSGTVARAAGSLKDGSGMLYDLHGRPLVQGSTQQAPISRTKRSPKDW